MRIDHLQISNFKNLKQFSIDFDENQLTTVLIGENGLGKSNLFEALTLIFRDLDHESPPSFSYTLKYQCWGWRVQIQGNSGKGSIPYHFLVDDAPIPAARFFKEKRHYLPRLVFSYYSGVNRRLEALYEPHQQAFVRALKRDEDESLRTLFYSRLHQSALVLLTYFAFPEHERPAFLRNELGIRAIDSALVVLRRPHWASHGVRDKPREGESVSFWGASGLIRDFLLKLHGAALAPIVTVDRAHDDYRKSPAREERLYLFLQNEDALRTLLDVGTTPQRLFKQLESLDILDILREVRIRVEREGPNNGVEFSDLSEGEQQLITVLGLLKLMHEHECLFLLDEPDTHLNPHWKLRYLDLIEQIVGNDTKSHLLVATHDPLTIAGLTRSQVQVFHSGDGAVEAEPPHESPRGLGVAGVLTKLFALPTTLDVRTQKKLQRRDRLFAKQERTQQEELLLRRLSDELADSGFMRTYRDPLYSLFVERLANRREFRKTRLTPRELARREEIADRVLDELLAGDIEMNGER